MKNISINIGLNNKCLPISTFFILSKGLVSFNSKVLILTFLYLLNYQKVYAQSKRETERLRYEKSVIEQINKLKFNDIPWLEIFQDAKLRPSEVKKIFELKTKEAGESNVNASILKKFSKYYEHTKGIETIDHQYIFQDDQISELNRHSQTASKRSASSANFTYIGQNNSVFPTNNGRIDRVNFHPTNTNIIWASAPEGGLWRSNNAGATWTVMSDFWDHQSVGDLVYNLNNNDTIYVATDDHGSWFNQNRGVLRSVDGGNTWNIVGLPNATATQVFKLAMAPDGRTLYACTSDGLFKSSNHGVTWVKNASLPATAKANDIEWHPTNPQVVYVSTRSGTDQHPTGGDNYNYFYISIDGGNTFTVYTTNVLNSKGRPSQVSVTPHNPDIVYLSVYPEEGGSLAKNQGGMIMKYKHSNQSLSVIVQPSFTFPAGNLTNA